MKERSKKHIEGFFNKYKDLECIKNEILQVCDVILEVYKKGGKVLICGNGGSCADGDHIVGELMKGFLLQRPLSDKQKSEFETVYGEEGRFIGSNLQCGLSAVSLNAHSALMSAFNNDVSPELVYAQQVLGYAKPDDAVIGISTSGNAKNVAYAIMTGNVVGAVTIGLTGRDGGKLAQTAKYSIISPEKETYLIQEHHLGIYHFICAFVESEMFEL